ncbi:MAG: hypothetical protein F7C38_07475 [Desulfurococcales archaeon]|nr:hypothetical protein [Desulfurococcales archaeon]
MEHPVSFTVPSFSIPYSKKQVTDTIRLNQFQSEVYDLLNKKKDILLTAPTGGGKTLTLLLNNSIDTRTPGFVALYPNNTLLLNQLCTVEDILVEHFGARLINSSGYCMTQPCKDIEQGSSRRCECCYKDWSRECVEPLSIYEIDTERIQNAWNGAKYVALLALSGRYIPSINGIPKRESLHNLARKILSYRKQGIYVIVFSTPDTFLLVMTGAYRDFDLVNKTVENLLLAIEEGKDIDYILRKTGVLTRSQVDETIAFVQRILNQPLFIDEFHLYGLYEVDALHALLNLYKELIGKPVVFSSATPARDILEEELSDTPINVHQLKAEIVSNGKGFKVRGRTEFIIVPVVTRRKGLGAFYEASDAVPGIVLGDLMDELKNLSGGRALLILERLWMVADVARKLASSGLAPECIASIVPSQVCTPGSKIIVGSEATTQGVNLGKVILGITGGISSEDVIQRIGRIGRRGIDSKIYLVIPNNKLKLIDNINTGLDYWRLVATINTIYPNYPKRKREVSRLIPYEFHKTRRRLIYTVGLVSVARVSGMESVYDKLKITPEHARRLRQSVVGSNAFVKLLVFRRTGFNVKYIVKETHERGESSIGLIARNFAIHGLTHNGELIISLMPARTRVRISVLGNPAIYKDKFVDLKILLKTLKGRIDLGEDTTMDPIQAGDALVYIVDAGEELTDYLSYTGEGAEIMSPRGRRYAVIFI